MNYFDNDTPSFVSVRGDSFETDGSPTDTLHVMIQKIQPVRKFFHRQGLICYSMDAHTSANGKCCIFCDDRYRCQKKLRLSMIDISGIRPKPIILEINQPSFDELKHFIETIGEEQIYTTPVTLKIVYDDNDRRRIEFMP